MRFLNRAVQDSTHAVSPTDLKDLQLRDQTRRGESLEESLADYEATIGQFRELVLSLQGCVVPDHRPFHVPDACFQ